MGFQLGFMVMIRGIGVAFDPGLHELRNVYVDHRAIVAGACDEESLLDHSPICVTLGAISTD